MNGFITIDRQHLMDLIASYKIANDKIRDIEEQKIVDTYSVIHYRRWYTLWLIRFRKELTREGAIKYARDLSWKTGGWAVEQKFPGYFEHRTNNYRVEKFEAMLMFDAEIKPEIMITTEDWAKFTSSYTAIHERLKGQSEK